MNEGRKSWPRRRKRRRRRMYRAPGNPRRSYIFLRERASLRLRSAIALRYAITRIYRCIIPRGLKRKDRSSVAYTQIRNRYVHIAPSPQCFPSEATLRGIKADLRKKGISIELLNLAELVYTQQDILAQSESVLSRCFSFADSTIRVSIANDLKTFNFEEFASKSPMVTTVLRCSELFCDEREC